MEKEKIINLGDEIIFIELTSLPKIGADCGIEQDNQPTIYYKIIDFEKIENGKYRAKMRLIGLGKK